MLLVFTIFHINMADRWVRLITVRVAYAMSTTETYLQIKGHINSGSIASLSKEELTQISIDLAKPQAYTHFGERQFRQVCDIVNSLLSARSTEVPNPTAQPSAGVANAVNHWYQKPLGIIGLTIVGGLLLAGAVYLIRQHLGVPL